MSECRICKKKVVSGNDKLAAHLHASCWDNVHKRLKIYGPTIKIKSWNIRLELNLHDLWYGLFWITKKDMYFGIPCLVLHVWSKNYENHSVRKRLKIYGPIIKIKSWNTRLELNLHNLWNGLFWITKKEMYFGIPCLVLHVWSKN